MSRPLETGYKHELLGGILTTPYYAYFKVAGAAAALLVLRHPLMRQAHGPAGEDLVKEANAWPARASSSRDLTYYGLQHYGERKLADLLHHLSDVNGIDWIRMQYATVPLDALDVMNSASICKVPGYALQHISDNMLKSMRRGISKRRTIRLDTIRQRVPDIALRTTFIASRGGKPSRISRELYGPVRGGNPLRPPGHLQLLTRG
jgi:ribosomal protein S12 methylthiotransferase